MRTTARWLLPCLLSCAVIACGGSANGGPAVATPPPADANQLQGKGSSPWEVGLAWETGTLKASVQVAGCRAFRQGLGQVVHLIGEVENTGDEPLGAVTVTAESMGRGKVLDARSEPAFVDLLGPGERSPFKVSMDMREVEKVRISVSAEPMPDAKPAQTLETLDVHMGEPASGYVHVQGQVMNTLGRVIDAVRLVIVVRDGQGEVLDVAEADLGGPIEPDASKPFDVLAMHRDAVSAEVRAEGKVGEP